MGTKYYELLDKLAFPEAALEIAEGRADLNMRDHAGRDIMEAAVKKGADMGEMKFLRIALTNRLTRETRQGTGEQYATLAAKYCIPHARTLVNGVPHSIGSAAVVSGQPAMLKAWLSAGGDPNARTATGVSLTALAVANNRQDMVAALTAANANLQKKDGLGASLLTYATHASKVVLAQINAALGADHLKPESGMGL